MTRFMLGALVALWATGARAKPELALAARLDAVARAELTARPTAGLSIAVAQKGQLVFARGYGQANLETATPVGPDTIFHIASISKNIEAAVLLQLVEQGKLSLDDDVTRFVPQAPTHRRRVTIRQLVNHTSGIHSYTSVPNLASAEATAATHDDVLALIRDRPLDFEPGTRFRYNNTGLYLGGMVVERVTGQEYGAYLREHVFAPLGLGSMSLCYARQVVPRRASGYEIERGKLVNAAPMTWRLPYSGGAVCATASDLARWADALDGGRVVGRARLAEMRAPTVLADGTRIDYGLGTRLGALDGHRVVGHTGSGGGFSSVMETFPDDQLTIVVLANSDVPAYRIGAKLARVVFGAPPPLVDLPVPTAEAAALVGRFDSDEGPIETFMRDGKLRFRPVGAPGDGLPVYRQRENVYAVDDLVEVHMVPRNGRVEWGIAYSGGLMMDPKYRVTVGR